MDTFGQEIAQHPSIDFWKPSPHRLAALFLKQLQCISCHLELAALQVVWPGYVS